MSSQIRAKPDASIGKTCQDNHACISKQMKHITIENITTGITDPYLSLILI